MDSTPEEVATELLAVLREALSNAARHAKARHVDVDILADGDIVLRWSTTGTGFRRNAKGPGTARPTWRRERPDSAAAWSLGAIRVWDVDRVEGAEPAG